MVAPDFKKPNRKVKNLLRKTKPIYGCYYKVVWNQEYCKVPVPLQNVHISGSICDTTANLTIQQTFFNPRDEEINITYAFPLDDNSAVVRFTATTEDRTITGEVKEKETARQEYETAIYEGHSAYLLEQNETKFSLSVGRLQPKKSVVITINYLTKLMIKDGNIVFVLPVSSCPFYQAKSWTTFLRAVPSYYRFSGWHKYAICFNDKDELCCMQNDEPTPMEQIWKTTHPDAPYSEEKMLEEIAVRPTLTVDITSQFCSPITKVSSSARGPWADYALQYVNAQLDAARQANIPAQTCRYVINPNHEQKKPDEPDVPTGLDMKHDLVLRFQTDSANTPRFFLETIPQSRLSAPRAPEYPATAMISFSPNFTESQQESWALKNPSRTEFIFVVDRSGSMSGDRIENSRQALSVFIRSLPADCYFNIIGFGSRFKKMSPTSVKLGPDSMTMANKWIELCAADMGGTRLFEPLKDLLKSPTATPQTVLQNIFVLTDGEVDNTLKLLEFVENNILYDPSVIKGPGSKVPEGVYSELPPGYPEESKTELPRAIRVPDWTSNQCDRRIFCLGLGSSVDYLLVNGLARYGRGTSAFISKDDSISSTVVSMLKKSRLPSYIGAKLEFTFDKEFESFKQFKKNRFLKKLVKYPGIIPPLFQGENAFFFVNFPSSFTHLPKSASISAFSPVTGKRVVWELPVTQFEASADPNTPPLIQTLAIRDHIQRLEMQASVTHWDTVYSEWAKCRSSRRGVDYSNRFIKNQFSRLKKPTEAQIIKLGISYQLVTTLTSFVAVDKTTKSTSAVTVVLKNMPQTAQKRVSTVTSTSFQPALQSSFRGRKGHGDVRKKKKMKNVSLARSSSSSQSSPVRDAGAPTAKRMSRRKSPRRPQKAGKAFAPPPPPSSEAENLQFAPPAPAAPAARMAFGGLAPPSPAGPAPLNQMASISLSKDLLGDSISQKQQQSKFKKLARMEEKEKSKFEDEEVEEDDEDDFCAAKSSSDDESDESLGEEENLALNTPSVVVNQNEFDNFLGDRSADQSAIIKLQQFNGTWVFNGSLASALHVSLAFLKKSLSDAESGDSDFLTSWATAIAIAYLESFCDDSESEWELLVQKAKDYLSGKGHQDLIERATNMF